MQIFKEKLGIKISKISDLPILSMAIVYEKNLKNINYYLQNREEQFSDKEVSRLIGRVKDDVTK